MKKILPVVAGLAVIVLIAGLVYFFSVKGVDDNMSPEERAASENVKQEMGLEDPDLENPAYVNEQEGVEVKEAAVSPESFIGRWAAGSDRASYLYGNVNLTVRAGGSWTGNITEGDYNGTWKYNGKGITLVGTEEGTGAEFTFEMFSDDEGVIMFREPNLPDDVLVLTPAM